MKAPIKIALIAIPLLLVSGIGALLLDADPEDTASTTSTPQTTAPTGTPEIFRQSDDDVDARLQEALNRSAQQETDDIELINEYGPENKITVLFQPDSSELVDREWENDIAIIADLLSRHPTLSVVVEGHAADVPSDVDGEELSEERAQVVAGILRGAGVPQEQIEIDVIAFDRAVGDNSTESGRALNRRAFVYVVFLF